MALLRQAYPAASVEDIELALTETANLGPDGVDNDYGYGLVDAVVANSTLTSTPGPICTDSDGDGYFTTSECGAVDCNDFEAGINPDACEYQARWH
jgi:hypothetical protein